MQKLQPLGLQLGISPRPYKSSVMLIKLSCEGPCQEHEHKLYVYIDGNAYYRQNSNELSPVNGNFEISAHHLISARPKMFRSFFSQM